MTKIVIFLKVTCAHVLKVTGEPVSLEELSVIAYELLNRVGLIEISRRGTITEQTGLILDFLDVIEQLREDDGYEPPW